LCLTVDLEVINS